MKTGNLLAMFVVTACGGPGDPIGVSPVDIDVDRTYTLQGCPTSACGILGGTIGSVSDSGRIVLTSTGSLTWTTWHSSASLNGKYVDVITGTYGFAVDGMHLQVSSGASVSSVLFSSDIPARVDPNWHGPDTLSAMYPAGNIHPTMRFK